MANETTAPITKEEILTYLYTKNYHCPVCEKDFMDFVVKKSKLRVISTDTDFMTNYKDIDPNHYEVLFCPHCGYATLSNYFDKITQIQIKKIQEKISPNYKPIEFIMPLSKEQVINRYKQCVLCAGAIDAKASQKAFIALKLAWVLRKMGQNELEKRFIKDACDGFQTAFTQERLPIGNMDEATAKYVIADLFRRTGDMGNAMRWVADVVTAKGIPGQLKDRATNLKDLIREGKID